LRVRLTPKAGHDRIDGVELRGDGAALKARVRAAPEDGKANAALEQVVAEWLGVARGSVAVTAGGKSRMKSVTVAGHASELVAALAVLLKA
jgi:uncharacterized protein